MAVILTLDESSAQMYEDVDIDLDNRREDTLRSSYLSDEGSGKRPVNRYPAKARKTRVMNYVTYYHGDENELEKDKNFKPIRSKNRVLIYEL